VVSKPVTVTAPHDGDFCQTPEKVHPASSRLFLDAMV
jgi:hypothetical protein